MSGCVLSRFSAVVPIGAEGYCLFWLVLVVDDISKHHARVSVGRERGRWSFRRAKRFQATEGGVSRYSESALSCRECRTVQPKRSVCVSILAEIGVQVAQEVGRITASLTSTAAPCTGDLLLGVETSEGAECLYPFRSHLRRYCLIHHWLCSLT